MNDSSFNTGNARTTRRHRSWIGVAGLTLVAATATVAVSRDSVANAETSGFERRCIGTYLVLEEGSLAQTLWTFHADNTLVSSSTGEMLFAFGSQQGSWRPDGRRGAKAVQLDFDWDIDGNLQAIGRVDIDVQADDRSCDSISGQFVGRLFAPGEDPLDIGETEPLFGDTVKGRRIQVP